jgi:hypothetical protein
MQMINFSRPAFCCLVGGENDFIIFRFQEKSFHLIFPFGIFGSARKRCRMMPEVFPGDAARTPGPKRLQTNRSM